jgi:hypothetical protein
MGFDVAYSDIRLTIEPSCNKLFAQKAKAYLLKNNVELELQKGTTNKNIILKYFSYFWYNFGEPIENSTRYDELHEDYAVNNDAYTLHENEKGDQLYFKDDNTIIFYHYGCFDVTYESFNDDFFKLMSSICGKFSITTYYDEAFVKSVYNDNMFIKSVVLKNPMKKVYDTKI